MAKSIVVEPFASGSAISSTVGLPIDDGFIISMATAADNIPRWGVSLALREQMLHDFLLSEPILMGALFSQIARYAAFGWSLKGVKPTIDRVHDVLHQSEHGDGWIKFMIKQLFDLFCRDNGAHMEVVRESNTATSRVVQLNHLDSTRCFRTGIREEPIVYRDLKGGQHLLKWYQVISVEEFPSPIESMRGYQYSALTRILSAAQRVRDINQYQSEKISGRFARAIHLVSGVSSKQVQEAINRNQEEADILRLARYVQPVVIGSIDPTANVTKATIEMASLPDGFNEETAMRWYINQLALTFGADYQDFAPLPGGNLGSAHQAEVLHLKSRGKGPALMMRTYEHKFNYHGVMPRTVTFAFGEQDVALDNEQQDLRNKRAVEHSTRIASGEWTPELARQVSVDEGDLDVKYLDMFGETNATPITRITSNVKEIVRDATGRAAAVKENGVITKVIERDPNTGQIVRLIEQ